MRFLGSKFTQNALAAGAPQTPCRFQGRSGRGKGKEGKEGGEKGEKGYWGRERGREGKRGGKKRGRRKEREGQFASLALGGIDAPGKNSLLCCSPSALRIFTYKFKPNWTLESRKFVTKITRMDQVV